MLGECDFFLLLCFVLGPKLGGRGMRRELTDASVSFRPHRSSVLFLESRSKLSRSLVRRTLLSSSMRSIRSREVEEAGEEILCRLSSSCSTLSRTRRSAITSQSFSSYLPPIRLSNH